MCCTTAEINLPKQLTVLVYFVAGKSAELCQYKTRLINGSEYDQSINVYLYDVFAATMIIAGKAILSMML